MNIKNDGDYARFCAENAERHLFFERIETIGHIARTALSLTKSFGGGNTDRVHAFIGEAINQHHKDGTNLVRDEHGGLDGETMALIKEILPQFWEFDSQASRWIMDGAQVSLDSAGSTSVEIDIVCSKNISTLEDTDTDLAVSMEDSAERAVA